MLFYYALPAGVVFLIVLSAFLVDQTTPKTNVRAWLFVVIATLIWPVTLPFIVWKKVLVPLGKKLPEGSDE
jgi:hypothetical protein